MKPPPLDDLDFAPVDADPTRAPTAAIRAELAPGERLVCVGQPRWFGAEDGGSPDALLAALGVVGVLAGLCAAALGLLRAMPGVAALGTVLIIGGVALLGAGVWSRHDQQDRATSYALTDRRIILREPVPFGQVRVRSYRRQDLIGISRTERPDGSDSITLEGIGPRPGAAQGPIPFAYLRRLDDVREVEALIRVTLFED